ncbi:hypothetical protein F2Q69_00051340 [Brassica cretica]|uniref:Uncharacterized protein n=1 Tax=Brassica cretica TaxID=69181 RepID=A0A8S9PWZ8_BRACR|nr:hypothetical protein F2Q69_00051340 [Brassica cretica]
MKISDKVGKSSRMETVFKPLLLLPDEAKKVHSLRHKIGTDVPMSHLQRFLKLWSFFQEEHGLDFKPIETVALS